MPHLELPFWFEQWRTRTSEPARLWGLALGADLALLNGARLDCLHTPYSRAAERESLRVWWRVTSTHELRHQLESLFDNGHADLFTRIVYACSEGLAFAPNLDDGTVRRIEFVRSRLPECRRAGHTRAFDLGRVPNLARFGYTAGFIDAVESWKWVERAAIETQPLFPSWAEFAFNYHLGHQFWDAAHPSNKNFFPHRDYLLTDAQSPWVRLPWDLCLNA